MNERIEELAEQAEKYADANFKGEHFWTQAYESKFAELIVKECMQVVRNGINNATDWDSSSWDQCCENRIYAIQRHFGVEQ